MGVAGGRHVNGGPSTGSGQGPTLTRALRSDSPAIDAGADVGCPSTDQRGYRRPVDGNRDGIAQCDIGAYEYWPQTFLSIVLR